MPVLGHSLTALCFFSVKNSLIDVDFDFFDPAPIDFIAIKRLLTQLFQADSEDLNIHELTELIISQPLLGTTVKTDGIDSDPYAFLTILNMSVHRVRDHGPIQSNYVWGLPVDLEPSSHQSLIRIPTLEDIDISDNAPNFGSSSWAFIITTRRTDIIRKVNQHAC